MLKTEINKIYFPGFLDRKKPGLLRSTEKGLNFGLTKDFLVLYRLRQIHQSFAEDYRAVIEDTIPATSGFVRKDPEV